MIKKTTLALFALLLAFPFSGFGQTVWSENFEGNGLPAGWYITTNASDGGWVLGTASSLSSQGLVFPSSNTTKIICTNEDKCNCDKSDDRLITAGIDLTNYTNLVLSMDLFFAGAVYNNVPESFEILATTDAGLTWTSLAVAPGGTGWRKYAVNISAMTGNPDVQFAFKFGDGGDWLYGAALDNIEIRIPNKRDIVLNSINSKTFGKVGVDREVLGQLTNNGSDTLKSVILTWSDGTTEVQQEYNDLLIPPFSPAGFVMTEPVILAKGKYPVTVYASNPNGLDDQDSSSDTLKTTFEGFQLNDNKGVLVEEATGTWCGWCPRGAVFLDFMEEEYGGQFVGVAVHNSDPMEIVAYDAGLTSFSGFAGFPSVLVNKTALDDPGTMEYPFLQSASIAPLATIEASATYAPGTRDLKIKTTATAGATAVPGAKFFITLIEDGVTGTETTYNQANYYAGGGVGPMAGWENLPNPVLAADMVYNHVARELFGSFNGIAGSVSPPLTAGAVSTFEINDFVVPDDFNMDNMHLVVALLNNNNRVVNVIKASLTEAVSTQNQFNHNLAKVLQNPFANVTYVQLELSNAVPVTMTVFNAQGQIVANKNYGKLSGNQVLPFDGSNLAEGMYLIHLDIDHTLVTKKVILVR